MNAGPCPAPAAAVRNVPSCRPIRTMNEKFIQYKTTGIFSLLAYAECRAATAMWSVPFDGVLIYPARAYGQHEWGHKQVPGHQGMSHRIQTSTSHRAHCAYP